MTISFQFSHIKSLKSIAHVVLWFVKYYESALDEERAWCQMATSHFFNQCKHSHMTLLIALNSSSIFGLDSRGRAEQRQGGRSSKS